LQTSGLLDLCRVACSDYAEKVNMGQALGQPHWHQVAAWRIPLSLMLNITRMRASHPVILVSDYLRLHDLSPDLEAGSGAWDRVRYPADTLFVVANDAYDPKGTVRVDYLPDDVKSRGEWAAEGVGGSWMPVKENVVSRYLRPHVKLSTGTANFDVARNILKRTEIGEQFDLSTDEGLITCLQEHGWEVLHTFDRQ
jgi:hypothetical protein